MELKKNKNPQCFNATTTSSKFSDAARYSEVNHKQKLMAKTWMFQLLWSRCFDPSNCCPQIVSELSMPVQPGYQEAHKMYDEM